MFAGNGISAYKSGAAWILHIRLFKNEALYPYNWPSSYSKTENNKYKAVLTRHFVPQTDTDVEITNSNLHMVIS